MNLPFQTHLLKWHFKPNFNSQFASQKKKRITIVILKIIPILSDYNINPVKILCSNKNSKTINTNANLVPQNHTSKCCESEDNSSSIEKENEHVKADL